MFSGVAFMVPVVAGSALSALFVDYDNIYLSLRRRSEEAAERFARDPYLWLAQIVSGKLIRYEWGPAPTRRRIAIGRCYGNPIPRRRSHEPAPDPCSFAFVRHHFMRAGFEVIDCPPLTAQLRNGADIRMAIDVRDTLDHQTRFDEFIILSGDADFTPVLHRLRSHDRRTVIYANAYTAAPYAALCDGRLEETALIKFLMENAGRAFPNDGLLALPYDDRAAAPAASVVPPAPAAGTAPAPGGQPAVAPGAAGLAARRRPANQNDSAIRALQEDFKRAGQEILTVVIETVAASERPLPIAHLADRVQKTLGQPKTIGTNWAGAGGLLNLLGRTLPESLKITGKPPHFVYDPRRHQLREESAEPHPSAVSLPAMATPPVLQPAPHSGPNRLAELQLSITRIYEACQAPPLPPSEYQLLFTLVATELRENGYAPERTAAAVVNRAQEAGLGLAHKDVSFVLRAVDEVDPWLEHSRSSPALARAYRDYVLARCRASGLQLTEDEHQLVQVWFGASQWSALSPPPPPSGPQSPSGAPTARDHAAGAGVTEGPPGLAGGAPSVAGAVNEARSRPSQGQGLTSEQNTEESQAASGRNPLRFGMFRRG